MKKYFKIFEKGIYKSKKVCYSKGKLTEVNMTNVSYKISNLKNTVIAGKSKIKENVTKTADIRFAEQEMDI